MLIVDATGDPQMIEGAEPAPPARRRVLLVDATRDPLTIARAQRANNHATRQAPRPLHLGLMSLQHARRPRILSLAAHGDLPPPQLVTSSFLAGALLEMCALPRA